MVDTSYSIDITPPAGSGPYQVKLSEVRSTGNSFVSIEAKNTGVKPSSYEERVLPFIPSALHDKVEIKIKHRGTVIGLFDDTLGKLTAAQLKAAIAQGFPNILESFATDILNKRPEALRSFAEYMDAKLLERAQQKCDEVGVVLNALGQCKTEARVEPASPAGGRVTIHPRAR